MILPIGDDNSDRHITPIVNYILIAINIGVFIFLQDWGRDNAFTFSYSAVPGEILTGTDITTDPKIIDHPVAGPYEQPGLGKTGIPVYLTLISSMFMHGGIAHLLGNMMFLWISGDNIENDLGHRNYLIFYLLCGILAGLAHVFSTAILGHNQLIPSLGASGAISGVLAGYMIMHPGRKVHVWILLTVISVPAFLAVGIWFVFQVINGMGALGGEEAGGVAYAAHIGGFVAGLLLIKLFPRITPKVAKERKGIF